MAADKSLIQGAAALAQADTAMGSAFTKGAAAGAAPVMKKFMEIQEREKKLDDQLVANAEAINMRIMTNPNAAGEYHDNIKTAATTTRSEILAIAKDKSLSRTERNSLITEKVDGFNSLTSKYLVGQKIEGDFKDNLRLGNFSNEDTALKEEAARLSSYFKGGDYIAPGTEVVEGEEGVEGAEGAEEKKKQFEIERSETGYIFKDYDGVGKDKVISFEELKNYLPKKIDNKALSKLELDITKLGKATYDLNNPEEKERFDEEIHKEANGYGIDERRNLLANKLKYMGDVSSLTDDQVDENFMRLFKDNVKAAIQPEDSTVKDAEKRRLGKIYGYKTLFQEIDKIQVTGNKNKDGLVMSEGDFQINNLPSNYSTFPQQTKDKDGNFHDTDNIIIQDNSTGVMLVVSPYMDGPTIARKLKGVYRQKAIDLGDDFGYFKRPEPPK